jgi:hypothetical protein
MIFTCRGVYLDSLCAVDMSSSMFTYECGTFRLNLRFVMF